jgi:hypothetical protein
MTVGARGVALTILGMLGVAFGGCAAGDPKPPTGSAGQSAERFYVVDCLLPAQIRKLGQSMTFLGPRRAVKTTAADCEIRGGEYVAYDRADYATALRVWLPLAQEGDKVAQTYVGEIYEKALGVPADYALAAAWYRKAAQQGYARAMIDLGHLYELGLGVEKDPVAALEWYRRASGLPEAITLDTASLNAEMRNEMARLRVETERQREESAALRRQLQGMRQQLAEARQELARRTTEAENDRQRTDQARRELERARQEAAAAQQDTRAAAEARVQTLEAELGRRQTELAQQREELARWADRVSRLEADTERRRREETAALAAQLADITRQLVDARRELSRRTTEVESQQQHLEQARTALDTARNEAQTAQAEERARAEAQARALEADLKARQAESEHQRQELARWRDRVARLEREAEDRNAPAPARAAVAVALAGPSIEMIEPSVVPTRGVTVVALADGTLSERLVVGRVTAPAGLMALMVNDREETVDANGLFRARVSVPAAGGLVRVVAVDTRGKRGDIEFRLAPGAQDGGARRGVRVPSGVKLRGTYYALVIGNVKYQHWPSLKSPEGDARKTAELLEKRYGFKTRLLLNANRYDTLQALNELRNQLTEEDNLLVYYAGHGYLDEKINRAYWIPIEGALDSNADWIPTVAITDLVGAISAKHILVVADSCYAGALTRSSLARLDAGMTDDARRHWIEVVDSKRSRTVLSSGDIKPVLDTGGGEHSVFARAWLDVLRKNEDVLEGERLHREIAARVAYAADALKFEQVPQYAPIRFAGHESGDFLFVPRDN